MADGTALLIISLIFGSFLGFGAIGGYFVFRLKGRNPWQGAIIWGLLGTILTPLAPILALPYLMLTMDKWEGGISPKEAARRQQEALERLVEPLIFEKGVDTRSIQMLNERTAIIPLGPRYLIPKTTQKGQGLYEANLKFPERCAWSLDTPSGRTRHVRLEETFSFNIEFARSPLEKPLFWLIGTSSNPEFKYTVQVDLELPVSGKFEKRRKEPLIKLRTSFPAQQIVLMDFPDEDYATEFLSLNRPTVEMSMNIPISQTPKMTRNVFIPPFIRPMLILLVACIVITGFVAIFAGSDSGDTLLSAEDLFRATLSTASQPWEPALVSGTPMADSSGSFEISAPENWNAIVHDYDSVSDLAHLTFFDPDHRAIIDALLYSQIEYASLEEVSRDFFTNSYFMTAWGQYDHFQELDRVVDNIIVINFSLSSQGIDYLARQIAWLNEGELRLLRIVVPANSEKQLEAIEELVLPTFKQIG